ncbi:MAG TPA: helix-turn-helix transcriptional regulator [Solirubrobacteraceae bacterium]|nr:helix-turn-helix transcriptional regulator [Solirubrobacteraceae bacterium]
MPPERKSVPRDPQLAALGEAIEQRIVEIGMSQSSLAGASGIDLRRINDYVRGQYNPSYRNMRKLCRALKISVDELMDRAEGLQKELSAGQQVRPEGG